MSHPIPISIALPAFTYNKTIEFILAHLVELPDNLIYFVSTFSAIWHSKSGFPPKYRILLSYLWFNLAIGAARQTAHRPI